MSDFLTISQAAERAYVTKQFILAEIARGNITGARKLDPSVPNSQIIIPLKDFQKWEAKRGTSKKSV